MCFECLALAAVKSVAISVPIFIVYIALKIKFLEWRDRKKK
tara:strand:+ start:2195 stop:2317 length:123 start_codon:yes stop_codon:yes gene_type:complete